jgi:hypothetical protein
MKNMISVKIHACKIFIVTKHNFKLCLLRKLSHFRLSNVSFVVSPSTVAVPVAGCRLMQALYAVYHKPPCRHEGRDARRRSNLNDICTCRGT